jgi:hypothetical protein
MAALEELLEGFREGGVRESSGEFTLAPDHVWKGLAHSLSDPEDLPRFLMRWLVSHPCQPQSIKVRTTGTSLTFCALEILHPNRICPAPLLDYAGKDIDLSRAIICAEKFTSEPVILRLSHLTEGWIAEFNGGPGLWRSDSSKPSQKFEVEISLAKNEFSRLSKTWKVTLKSRFGHCPADIRWNQESLNASFQFSTPTLVWRRILPLNSDFPLVSFQPPEGFVVDSYVSQKHPHSEILMAIGDKPEGSLRVLHQGEALSLDRPGFLPGFEILINTNRLTLDMQGTSVVQNDDYEQLLQELRGEAYDMVLQLYRATPPLAAEVIARHLLPLESALLYLLDQQRYTEGHLLAQWIESAAGSTIAHRRFRDAYTFLRASYHFAAQSNQPRTAETFASKAKRLVLQTGSTDSAYPVEGALIDAHLEAKIRRDEPDQLTHHTRSHLHLLAIRCRQRGQVEHAYRLFFVLVKSLQNITPEHLDIWFEAVELANELSKRKALRRLARHMGRSERRGTIQLSDEVKKRAMRLLKIKPGGPHV